MKSLKDMIVTLTQLGVSSVSFVPSGNQVSVTAVKKNTQGAIMRRCSKKYQSIDLGDLASQICTSSHSLYMIGWDAKVEFVNHRVSRVEFRSLGRISARSHSPEHKYLLAANS
ncbi:MAG: hypothetical protein PHC53_03110 [Patescibacteria group bacterium]|nr:hypothetical protein [Patescibacteria group bacterium]